MAKKVVAVIKLALQAGKANPAPPGSFTFITKTPPASVLISKATGIEKGAATSSKGSVGAISRAQREEIAKTKLPDLHCSSVDSAMRIMAGTAGDMGVASRD